MIRRLIENDIAKVFQLMKEEGEDWRVYYEENVSIYTACLKTSITYVLEIDDTICGYARGVKDGDLYLYIADLLVGRKWRGHNYGHQLMLALKASTPNLCTYVMSDVDAYYSKLHYVKEGSVFEVIGE